MQAQTPVSMNGKLKLVGNQLSSECGNAVQLRGMSTHGVNFYPDCVNKAAFTALSSDWKCDVVRLAMYVNEHNGYLTDPAGWRSEIDRWVDEIGALGMYCLIDWHTLTPGDPNANLASAKEFWEHMSKKHSGKKHVLYEICNEPNGVDWNTIKTYANTIIPIIRANDPSTIIIVGTPFWSGKPGDVVNSKLTGINIMYTFHFYAASHSSYRSEVQSAAASIPIFATEWGLSDATGNGAINISEGQLWMDIFAGNNSGSQKISWCNWSFSDKNEASASLKANSCSASSWTNVTTTGAQVKTWISNPGKNFKACTQVPTCKAPKLGSDVSLCGLSGGVTLNTGLSATNKKFVWKRGTTTLSETTPTITTSTAGTYSVTVDSMGCVNTDEVVLASTLPAVSLGPAADLCNPSTKVLDAGVSGSALTYKWKKGSVVVGGNTKTYTATEAGNYSVTISATNCTDQTGSVVITSSLPTVANDTICKNETASLKAIGTGPFDWYATSTSAAKLFTGATFTPAPTATTIYYVQATPGQDYKMGPAVKGDDSWGITDYTINDKQILIQALGNVTLKSVDVEPKSGAQNVTINITDVSANSVIKTVTQAVSTTQTAINIGASLVSGKKYKIDAVGTSGELYFSTKGAAWPQTTANVATVQANDGVSWANTWTAFMNITFSTGKACNRIPVSVVLDNCTGIEEETDALNSVRVFPNPSDNSFYLSLGAGNGLVQKIELSDMDGRILETKLKAQMEEQMFFGENLPNGQYYLRIITNNKVVVKPLIKLK